jgi:hypothetical protein
MMRPAGGAHVGMGGREGGKKSAIHCPPHEQITADLPVRGSASRAEPPVRAAHAEACDRFILAGASHSCRPFGPRTRGTQRRPERLVLAARRRPKEGEHVPNATRTVPGGSVRKRSRMLLRVRTAGLSLRVACGSMGSGTQQECDLACRLCGRLAILECAERASRTPAAIASAPLRRVRRTTVEVRRSRPPRRRCRASAGAVSYAKQPQATRATLPDALRCGSPHASTRLLQFP